MKSLLLIALSVLIVGCASHNSDSSTTSDKNLCDINLNKIANYSAQYAMTTGEPEKSQLKSLHAQAKQYKEAGDIKNCIATSEQALSIIGQHTSN